MLSRVVDSLYWMSRYLERAEHTARLIDVHLNLMLDMAPGMVEQQRLTRLLQSLALKPDDITLNESDELLRWLTFDTENYAAITANITAARDNAAQVREQISTEMWTQINTLYLHVKNANANTVWKASPHDYYLEIRSGSHLFQGVTDATMNHNQGWHFIQLGRYIERIFSLLNLLGVHLGDENLSGNHLIALDRYYEWIATLKSVTAFEAYCKVYNPDPQPSQIVEFLLFNKEFPRSVRFCVDEILTSLNALADSTNRSKSSYLFRVAGRMQSNLSYDDMTDIHDLHEYLQNIKQQTFLIHDTLDNTYISYPIETALR